MNRVAIVTGGNRGIGLGISTSLIAEGVQVAVVATRPEPDGLIESLGGPEKAAYFQGRVDDVAAHAQLVADIVDRFGRIDILVNNAGVAPQERLDILDATPESYDRVMDINLRGPYFLTQAVARQMLTQERGEEPVRGTIVNVSSISADTVSVNRGEYCISKAGGSMATKLWAVRLAPEGIPVYEIRPGVVATDMTAGVKEKYDALFAQGMAPMPRWGAPSDVGGAVVALTSGLMPYSTGDVIHVDGGMHIPTL
ncbi:3-ketoacyl-ACP reductase [Tessaracoccus defluvii]|uniref:3-ketoacyl-ACP reductase n=1 Tax=Tessaracoccus defluvii TaxID=1285901 RepID=A0A7H0H5D5_9ACTN|nr:3-ketoacyl-ACP reductase [Tessaracoccus defluvii]QNP55751.1 3-ketoacyl-ACP reductase [Tessaracoccus defluvii]